MTPVWRFINHHRRAATAVVLLLFILLGGCSFPIYNFTHKWPVTFTFFFFAAAIMVYAALGKVESVLYRDLGILQIALLNYLLAVAGMGFRYLLELGEVSNSYNFTGPNIALHIFAAVSVSVLSWLKAKNKD